MNNLARINIFTGKGGVGKTSLALSFTKFLKDQNKKVLYCDFDQNQDSSLAKSLNIDVLNLNVMNSAEEYVGKKLGSKTVANWVMKTPFFSSLFKMVPGLGNMILLGHLIDLLEHDHDLHVVLDSPSSGHALTMLESPYNFKEMFGTGLIVKDIERMERFINSKNGFSIHIISLPSQMALTEASELKSGIKDLNYKSTNVINNDLYYLSDEVQNSKDKLPDFLLKKIELEESLLSKFEEDNILSLPHVFDNDMKEVILKLTPFMKEIVK